MADILPDESNFENRLAVFRREDFAIQIF